MSPFDLPMLLIAALVPLVLITGYFHGPGWLAHSECPHCCWCTGRVPLGDRIEQRIADVINRGEEA